MRHLLMNPAELGQYHLDRPAPLEMRRMLAILVESGVPEDEARRRLEGHPALSRDLTAQCERKPARHSSDVG